MDIPIPQQVDILLKLSDVIGNRKRGIVARIPMSKSKFYDGIRRGVFPPPLHIGCGSYWRSSDIQKIIDTAGGGVRMTTDSKAPRRQPRGKEKGTSRTVLNYHMPRHERNLTLPSRHKRHKWHESQRWLFPRGRGRT